MHQMEIRVAGAGGADLHQHLTRPRFQYRHLPQFGGVGGHELEGEHRGGRGYTTAPPISC
jgi:hypothetical protein